MNAYFATVQGRITPQVYFDMCVCRGGVLLLFLKEVLNNEHPIPYTLRNKNETFLTMLKSILQTLQVLFGSRHREMLHWYLTAPGLTVFNQSLADQDLGRLLLILTVRHRVSFNNIKLLANELFLLEHLFIL